MLNETISPDAFAAYPTLDFSAGLKLFTLHFNAYKKLFVCSRRLGIERVGRSGRLGNQMLGPSHFFCSGYISK
jgi:hypothetical protein